MGKSKISATVERRTFDQIDRIANEWGESRSRTIECILVYFGNKYEHTQLKIDFNHEKYLKP